MASITSAQLLKNFSLGKLVNTHFQQPALFQRFLACIIVEGNISAGKTTLAVELGKRLGYHVFLEPMGTNPFLEEYYKHPKKYGLVMQIWLLRARFYTFINALKLMVETGKGVILDRSVYSDIVFAEKNWQDGNISDEGYGYYLDLRNNYLQNLPDPSITVYLDVHAKVCYDRIHNTRQRDCESSIPLEYLSGLSDCYKSFLERMAKTDTEIIQLDWDKFGTLDVLEKQIRNIKTKPYADPRSLHKLLYEEAELKNAASLKKTPATVDLSLLLHHDSKTEYDPKAEQKILEIESLQCKTSVSKT